MKISLTSIGIKSTNFETFCSMEKFPNMGGGQNLERPNVERPIFRKFETSNIKITKVELFDFFVFQIYFLFLRLFELFEQILNNC